MLPGAWALTFSVPDPAVPGGALHGHDRLPGVRRVGGVRRLDPVGHGPDLHVVPELDLADGGAGGAQVDLEPLLILGGIV